MNHCDKPGSKLTCGVGSSVMGGSIRYQPLTISKAFYWGYSVCLATDRAPLASVLRSRAAVQHGSRGHVVMVPTACALQHEIRTVTDRRVLDQVRGAANPQPDFAVTL